jgi:uroporphyrinogen decarboxylase
MTPREAMLTALKGGRPDSLVPHIELEFQLTDELFGPERQALRDGDLRDVTGPERQDRLKRNAEMWVEVAKRFKLNTITGLHWLNLEDQCRSFEYIHEIAGDTYMLSAFVDGTFSIPNGDSMVEHVVWLNEKADEALAQAQAQAEGAVATAKGLIEAGAEVVFMCADYCFNDGPFLSPRMFARFVTPYLKVLVDGIHEAGGYAVKHTDGDIMPILDQMVGTGIDALHSLDPMAGVDIRAVRALCPDLCLIGNVNCALVQAGTIEETQASARYCLEHGGVKHGAYVFATSNCIFKGVPLPNYEAMLAVRDELGYPEAWG